MKCDDFFYYSESQKADIIDEFATRIALRYEPEYYIELYQLEDFYVELKVCVNTHVSLDYAAFKDMDRLAPYLEHVDISGLFEIK